MSSTITSQAQPQPGTWTEIVRAPSEDPKDTGLPLLTWSDTPEHYLQTITARRFYSCSRTHAEQYREWQFSAESRKFVARTQHHVSKDGVPSSLPADKDYRELGYVELVGVYDQFEKSVPEWVRSKGNHQERLLSKLSPENLKKEDQRDMNSMSAHEMQEEIRSRVDSTVAALNDLQTASKASEDGSERTTVRSLLESARLFSILSQVVLEINTEAGSNGSNGSTNP